ncbi:MAG: HTH domain-containing protein [Clostridia bacterium]|nr:HTH domain-containing protein [Clostridia bacterium]
MSKNLDIIMLYDFYHDMLTDKQAEVIDLYYNEDLSLAEISEHLSITRQGVRDNIKRAENILLELESKIGALSRYQKQRSEVLKAKDISLKLLESTKGEVHSEIKKIYTLLCGIEE